MAEQNYDVIVMVNITSLRGPQGARFWGPVF